MNDDSASVAVVGSLNVDLTFRVPRLPRPGETITSQGMLTCFGGKGANQAVAAARAGAKVRFLGCVGNDDHGARYLEYLQGQRIATAGITRVDQPTGSAFIAVEDSGENTIIVNPGANHFVTPELVDEHAEVIRGSSALLLQLECPLSAIRRAAQIARDAGVKVILNPSPWHPDWLELPFPIDLLIVNESEAAALGAEDPGAIGCESILITNGPRPIRVVVREGNGFAVLPPRVTPVDTVGAGDTFAGALAASLVDGTSLQDAVSFAAAAAALATLRAGAQPAIPHREEIVAFVGGSALPK